MNIKVTVGIACNRVVKPKTMACLLEMIVNGGYDFHIVIAEHGYTIAENRLYCAAQAVQNKSDYLLYIDDDMTFPPETLEQLLSNKKEIVGVVASPRMITDNTTVALLDGKVLKKEDIPKELFEVSHVGTGVMLIDTKVFEKIEQPYFQFTTYPNGMTLDGEDAWFCKQARKAGLNIYCDPTLSIGHLGDYLY